MQSGHTIKGVTGNLSLTPLYETYSEIVRLLCAGKPEEAKHVMQEKRPVWEAIVACIEKYADLK